MGRGRGGESRPAPGEAVLLEPGDDEPGEPRRVVTVQRRERGLDVFPVVAGPGPRRSRAGQHERPEHDRQGGRDGRRQAGLFVTAPHQP
jgi:hypothetical protein